MAKRMHLHCYLGCGAKTIVDRDDLAQWWSRNPNYLAMGPCSKCGYKGCIVTPIKVKTGTRKCGAWCEEGTGKSCTCECGGLNHGRKIEPGVLWYLR